MNSSFSLSKVVKLLIVSCLINLSSSNNLAANDIGEMTSFIADSSNLKILTWNIYLLPTLIRRSKQKERGEMIAEKLNDATYDIIVFQEAFHKRTVKKLKQQLLKNYPYQSDVANNKRGLRLNSGVFVVSKLPFKVLDQIQFADCKKADCFSRKGALMLEINEGNLNMQIIGTHLQADYTDRQEHQFIRDKQYVEIVEKLLLPYEKEGVPQLICGDLNTLKGDSIAYGNMLNTLQSKDGKIKGKYTYAGIDFGESTEQRTTQYQLFFDYILYKGNGKKASIKRKVRAFRHKWGKNRKYLSDHHAVEAIIEMVN